MRIENIFDEAIECNASDIHLVSDLKPKLRVKNNLIESKESVLTQNDMYEIYDYIVKGNIKKDELYKKFKTLDTSLEYKDTFFRVNVSSANNVPIFTLRLINSKLPNYEQLGLPDIVRESVLKNQGIILITGKVGSGKTTTLNTLINEINETESKKILTLENPIEYRHKCKKSLVIQKEVGLGGDLNSFSEGVKNCLKEDADILICGEIKDRETINAAIEMAESGHLVIGTLHTKSCAETIDRLVNFYEISDQMSIKYLLSSLLKLIVSQRLVKTLDDKCILAPEIMVVDSIISGYIRKEKFNISEIEDCIQSSKESISLTRTLAKLYIDKKISLDTAKENTDERNIDVLNRTIMQMRMRG